MNENTDGKENLSGRSTQHKRSIFDVEETELGRLVLSEDSDSDSSTDNFQKRPERLTDLFLSKTTIKKDAAFEITKDVQVDVAKQCLVEESAEKMEFYDFSKILETQQEFTVFTQKLSDKQTRPRRRKAHEFNSNDIDYLDVKDLLKIGENKRKSIESTDEDSLEEGDPKIRSEDCGNDSIEEIQDCELKPIQVTVQEPNLFCGGKKGGNRLEIELKRLLNFKRRSDQIILHKAHLVCLIANGCFINSVANCEELLAIALSFIPSKKYYPPAKTSKAYVKNLLDWFCTKVKLRANENSVHKSLLDDLIEDFAACAPRSQRNMVLLFILIGRVLGLQCRLVTNLCPVPLKPPPAESTDREKYKQTTEDKAGRGYPSKKASVTLKRKSESKNDKLPTGPVRRKVLSSDDEDYNFIKPMPKKKSKNAINIWSEVYVEAEGRWLSVNVVQNEIDAVEQIHEACTSPVSYILAWNSDGTIKDVTRRYVPQWHMCLKTRVEPDWWNSTLCPWKACVSFINEQEDKQLEKKIEEMPFPSSIREFKNHPLYALKRDLLKFEAVYPPTAVPLGQIKGEYIYARACVVELHTKESWKKEGKVLRPNQEPYKIVKARPKRERGTNKLIKDLPLNLYGHWQVENYIPPAAIDGKVPRNEFGNVEVYKPTMLPRGTVHLQLPGLMRVAKKLNIDCAHAVVGWEFRGQGSHPVLDGVVVCEEFKQQLLDAWNKEVDETEKRHKEGQTKRALSNWRKVVKAILLRKKLKSKYGFKFSKIISKSSRCRKKNRIE